MRVYDCFTFFNELDLLEIRLNELASVVDYFVLVEATKTFSGKSKVLWYNENKTRFSNYTNKIIHIVVDDMPKVKNGDRWELERYQRRQIARALQACDQSDIILISDVDEIPDKKILYEVIRELSKASLSRSFEESVTYFLHKLSKESTSHIVMDICRKFRHLVLPTKWIYRFRHRHHEYFLNGYVNDNIPGAAVMRFSTLAKVFDMDCNEIRSFWIGGKCRFVKGGWHFSYLGGVDKIINKIQSFSHSEFDTDIYKDKERIEALMEDGSNLYGKTGGGHNITYVEIDETYPKFVLQNRERLKGYIKEF